MFIELLNPKNDYVFKRIFGHKGNEEITKQMLSTIIKKSINNITLDENTILEKDLIDDKVGLVDIHAKIDETVDVDIEMQVVEQKDIEKRILFYWSKLYIKGITSGEQYTKLNKAIAILITDAEIPKLNKISEFYTKWQIREEKHVSVILTDVLEIYIIELPKAIKYIKQKNIVAELKEIEPWLKFLESPEDMEMDNMSEKNTIAIAQAKKVLEEISSDEHERYLAELREKYIRDQKATEEYGYDKGMQKGIEEGLERGFKRGYDNGLEQGVQKGLQQGIEKGIEQGMQQGLQQGIEKGIEQGIEQGMQQGLQQGAQQSKIDIAKKLLKQNVDIKIIISTTGLSKEEIEKLK